MTIKQRSEVAELFPEMQNDIARHFKIFVIKIWNSCSSLDVFQRTIRAVAKQHTASNFQDKKGLIYDNVYEHLSADYNIEPESVYRDYMTQCVFEYSAYNDVDRNLDQYEFDWDFDFDSMSDAFEKYMEQAIVQFAAGKNIDDKIFRSLAIIAITEEYKQDNIKLTLRQLYYQLVSKNYIENKEEEYKKIIDLTGNMREFNVLELDEFADNTRFAIRYTYQDTPKDYALKVIDPNQYFRDSRENQSIYLEVWIEKEALRSVVKPVTDRNDVPLFICRGYPSKSSLFDQAESIFNQTKNGRLAEEIVDVVILYFGDHDPSGLQIPQAIESIFHRDYQMQHVTVLPCALTRDQVRQFNLPPNPAKSTDPRAEKYIERHGTESWELDALPPKELQRIVELEISARTDEELVSASRQRMRNEREQLTKIKQHLNKNWKSVLEG